MSKAVHSTRYVIVGVPRIGKLTLITVHSNNFHVNHISPHVSTCLFSQTVPMNFALFASECRRRMLKNTKHHALKPLTVCSPLFLQWNLKHTPPNTHNTLIRGVGRVVTIVWFCDNSCIFQVVGNLLLKTIFLLWFKSYIYIFTSWKI